MRGGAGHLGFDCLYAVAISGVCSILHIHLCRAPSPVKSAYRNVAFWPAPASGHIPIIVDQDLADWKVCGLRTVGS